MIEKFSYFNKKIYRYFFILIKKLKSKLKLFHLNLLGSVRTGKSCEISNNAIIQMTHASNIEKVQLDIDDHAKIKDYALIAPRRIYQDWEKNFYQPFLRNFRLWRNLHRRKCKNCSWGVHNRI